MSVTLSRKAPKIWFLSYLYEVKSLVINLIKGRTEIQLD